jgi:hypothetical protein
MYTSVISIQIMNLNNGVLGENNGGSMNPLMLMALSGDGGLFGGDKNDRGSGLGQLLLLSSLSGGQGGLGGLFGEQDVATVNNNSDERLNKIEETLTSIMLKLNAMESKAK